MIISQNVPQVDTTNMHISAYFNDFLAKSHLMNNLEVSTFLSILFLLGVCHIGEIKHWWNIGETLM